MSTVESARPLLSRSGTIPPSEAASALWQKFCEKMTSLLPDTAFHTWFRPLAPVEFKDQTLTVQVPSRFYYEWIEGHYASQIDNALQDVLGHTGRLIYTTGPDDVELPTAQMYPAPVKKPEIQIRKNASRANGLNPRYTFDTFIEGPPNRFARAASYAVGRSPGKTAYNPLLLYGGVGLGKTHLLQAIGHEVLAQNPAANVRFISSERFTQEFVEAIRSNRADEFSARWRKVDVLLLDDVQFLVGRDRTQMEFFHTFNSLHQAGKQIVLTSDKPPRELGGLDERLVSRIGWGLVCDIGPPDFDTRLAIIQRFAEEEGVDLDPDVSAFLAEHITQNVRELQGALIRLLAHSSLNDTDITVTLAAKALQDLIHSQQRRISVDTIQRVVANHFGVPPDLLLAKIRTQPIARARMVAMSLTVELAGMSLKQVGRHFGKRDHTTVLHARTSIQKWIKEDQAFASTLERLTHQIREEEVS